MQSFHDEDGPAGVAQASAHSAAESKLETDMGTRDNLGQEE